MTGCVLARMAYITRLSHFTFSKEGDELLISSERTDFERRFDWPDDLSMTDEDLHSELHDRFYTDVKVEYDQKT